MGRGRPSKYQDAVKRKLVKALSDGNYRATACRVAGVSVTSFCRWLADGKKKGEGPYWELWQAVLKAEADAEAKMVKTIVLASKKDAKHAQWWLERKFPERWCSKARIEIQRIDAKVDAIMEMVNAGKA